MATSIEIEAKVLISEEDYKRVIKHYKKEYSIKKIQNNYFIDTDDLILKKYDISLRIREKGYFIMNIKTPLQEGLLEKRQTISQDQYEDFLTKGIFPAGDIKDLLLQLGIKIEELKVQASLLTERIEIENLQDGSLFSIDKNTYNGRVDYELELSGTSLERATADLKERCNQLGIDFVQNSKSKQIRALETIVK